MSEACYFCKGTGQATPVGHEPEECPICYGKGESGKCASYGEDELEGGVCKYCGAAE